jgi:hypothetical protein
MSGMSEVCECSSGARRGSTAISIAGIPSWPCFASFQGTSPLSQTGSRTRSRSKPRASRTGPLPKIAPDIRAGHQAVVRGRGPGRQRARDGVRLPAPFAGRPATPDHHGRRLLKKRTRCNAKRIGQCDQLGHGDVRVRELDSPDVLDRDPEPLGKLLLGPAETRPELGDSPPDGLFDSGRVAGTHGQKVPGTR